jgi:hypothetical protein
MAAALIACGRAVPAASPVAPSPASPTASPVSSAGWTAYTHPKWRYSLRYPADWYDLPNAGAPDQAKYFGNERVANVHALSVKGLFLSITLADYSEAKCKLTHSSWPVVSEQTTTIDGVLTRLLVTNYPSFETSAYHTNSCYVFQLVAGSADARDAALPVMQAFLGSFRFNT